MQLFIILILVTLPIILVQFYSTNSHALISEGEQVEALFKKITLPESENLEYGKRKSSQIDTSQVAILQDASLLLTNEVIGDMQNAVGHTAESQVDPVSESAIVASPGKLKKVRLVKGKKHAQGMNFLSVLLMLKEKQR